MWPIQEQLARVFQHGANDSMKIGISDGRATSGITYVCMASHFS